VIPWAGCGVYIARAGFVVVEISAVCGTGGTRP
jgi:hypothetical protein